MRETSIGGAGRGFESTAWSVILRARDRKEWGGLVDRYWKPCYFFIRRRGYPVEDSKDLTQSFFADIVERDALAAVTRSKGRFRSFLLACLGHFLSNESDRRRAKKRAGKNVSLDFDSAEGQFADSKAETPDKAFHRQWAVAVVEKALANLRNEIGARFDVLQEYITAGRPGTLRDIAEKLRLSESNVKVILHRTRKRYRDILREEVARTVERPDEVDDELKSVFAALA